jgi:hypothetical protein
LLGLAAVLALVVGVLAIAASEIVPHLGQNVRLTIDGEAFDLGELSWHTAFAAALALFVALAVVATVVPLALLLAAGIVVVVLAVVAFSLFGVAALVLAPLLLPLLGVWLLVRWMAG